MNTQSRILKAVVVYRSRKVHGIDSDDQLVEFLQTDIASGSIRLRLSMLSALTAR